MFMNAVPYTAKGQLKRYPQFLKIQQQEGYAILVPCSSQHLSQDLYDCDLNKLTFFDKVLLNIQYGGKVITPVKVMFTKH
jgi:hypothetical protein